MASTPLGKISHGCLPICYLLGLFTQWVLLGYFYRVWCSLFAWRGTAVAIMRANKRDVVGILIVTQNTIWQNLD